MRHHTAASSSSLARGVALLVVLAFLVAATAACAPRYRRDAILTAEERRIITSAAIVTSRVIESPGYALTRSRGVAVFDRQYSGMRTSSLLGMSAGQRVDDSNAARLQTILEDVGYDIEEEMARAVYEALSPRARFSLWAPADVEFLDVPYVRYEIDHEIVRRHADYRKIARQLPADVLIDVRVVEWALVYHAASEGLQLRLRVRLKVIKHPENRVLFHDELVNEPEDRKTGYTIDDFMANQANLLKRATSTAVEAMARDIVARLTL